MLGNVLCMVLRLEIEGLLVGEQLGVLRTSGPNISGPNMKTLDLPAGNKSRATRNDARYSQCLLYHDGATSSNLSVWEGGGKFQFCF
eukprot:2280184-Amphidinium_carterae.1